MVDSDDHGDDLVVVNNLVKYFPVGGGWFQAPRWVRAVDDISFTIKRGETLGLVGESGCGKTTCGRLLLKLLTPTSGEVVYKFRDGTTMDVFRCDPKLLREARKKVQIIFQDPQSSLNPRYTIRQTLMDPYLIHGLYAREERLKRIYELLEVVGLRRHHVARYPHEFSGGQRQRIGIARALSLDPEFIVCDEPVAALDVSVRAQVLNLMMDLQKQFDLTYIFISHDLSVVRHISDRTAIMYVGEIVELAETQRIFKNPTHPYAEALLSAIPVPSFSQKKKKRIILKGDVPSPVAPPSGCRFHPRCLYEQDKCSAETPEGIEVEPGHVTHCWFPLTGM